MIYQKILAFLVIFFFSAPLFPHTTWAISSSVAGQENYPGKMERKNINGIGKNISNDLFSGGMTFRYPLTLPTGPRGMTPSIEFSYNSNNTDPLSPYGYGFSLSLPRIQRSAKKGVSEIYVGHEYSAFGNDLIPEATGSNIYRSKDMADMNRYTYMTTGWTVETPDGKILVFGESSTARIADPDDREKVYAWLLESESDQFGHTIAYSYFLDGAQSYIQKITYGFTEHTQDPLYTISFDYLTKKNALSSYRTQFEIPTRKLLAGVTLLSGGIPVHSYELFYDDPDRTISHLVRITEKTSKALIPATSFSYGDGQFQHLITGIDNHRGGRARFEYAPSTGYRTESEGILNSKLPFMVMTLSRQVLEEGITGTISDETYTYEGGHYYFDSTDFWGREYVGFAKVTALSRKTKKILYFHQSQTAPPDPQKYQDYIAKKGRIYKTELYDRMDGKILSTELVRYDMGISGMRRLVFPAYTIHSDWSDDGTHIDTATAFLYDGIGNILEEKRYGFVKARLEDATFQDIVGDETITDWTYTSNPQRNLFRFNTSEKMFGFSGELLAESHIEYDHIGDGVERGLMTKKSRKNIDTGEIHSDSFEYTPKGLLREKIDGLGNSISFSYDSRDISLISQGNPLGWIVKYTYNYPVGKIQSVEDYNGVKRTTVFDDWGRESESWVTAAEGKSTLLQTIEYDDTSVPNSVHQTIYFDPDRINKKTTTTYIDGWGRGIQMSTTTEKEGQYSTNHVRYDEEGNPLYVGYPVFTSGSIFGVNLIASGVIDGEYYRAKNPGASYNYDALGRITEQRDSRGHTTKAYLPNTETVTDTLGNMTTAHMDAYGNLRNFVQTIEGRDITTQYRYDGLSRPIQLIDTYGDIRNWKYDSLSRLMGATDLHHPSDSTYGIRSYDYDRLGRVKQYTNADNEKVIYTYDPLSRLVEEQMGSGVIRNYIYDTGEHSLGLLSRVTDPSTTVEYGYDAFGRKIREKRIIENNSYILSYQYGIQNTLERITYPDEGRSDRHFKNGYMTDIGYTDSSLSSAEILSDIVYAPNATIQSMRYGNGMTRNIDRDPNYNYRLRESMTQGPDSGILLDTHYTYNALDAITRISEDGIEPLRKTIDYSYDALDRLTRGQYEYALGGFGREKTKDLSYLYDDRGNIMNASSIGIYSYGETENANPYAVTHAGGTSYDYDRSGNTRTRVDESGTLSFTYSSYGEMLSSERGGIMTDYLYDHTRRRIQKSTPGRIEDHVIDGYEVEYESGFSIEFSTGSSSNTDTGLINSDGGIGPSISSGSILSDMGSGMNLSGSIDSGTGQIGGTYIHTGGAVSSGITDGSGIDGPALIDSGSLESGSHPDISSIVSENMNSHSGSPLIIAGYIDPSTPVTIKTTLTHIMLGDQRIATIQSQSDEDTGTRDTGQLIYHVADHLNSSSLDISSTGVLLQVTDTLPFGQTMTYSVTSQRIKGKKGGYKNKYLFANKQFDEETDLQYFEKRYYDNRIGRFTTEDPVFWEVGLTKRPFQYFSNPQEWNNYSYVRNNPINLTDPTGEEIDYTKKYFDPLTDSQYYKATNLTLKDTDSHYLSSNGTAVQVSINELNTSFITPESFSIIKEKINAGISGEYIFHGTDAKRGLSMSLGKDFDIFGDLTFKAEGTLKIFDSGRWAFNGTLKAYDDVYDFTITKQDMKDITRWPRNIGTYYIEKKKFNGQGKPYYIQIRGEKKLSSVGYGKGNPDTLQGSTLENKSQKKL